MLHFCKEASVYLYCISSVNLHTGKESGITGKYCIINKKWQWFVFIDESLPLPSFVNRAIWSAKPRLAIILCILVH